MDRYDYHLYNTFKKTGHMHDLEKELGVLAAFLEKNGVKAGNAIDIGCGDGKVTCAVKEVLGIDSISGLDINEELLKKAEERGVETITSNFNDINIDRKYDLVMCYGSLHHSSDKPATVRNIVNLADRFVLIVDLTVRNKLFHKFTNNRFFRFDATSHEIWSRKRIEDELMNNGCRIVDSLTNNNANYFHDRSFVLAECTGE